MTNCNEESIYNLILFCCSLNTIRRELFIPGRKISTTHNSKVFGADEAGMENEESGYMTI